MKIIKCLTNTIILGSIFFTSSAYAYNPGNADERCIAPKFRNFVPPEKTIDTPVPEVAAESEISFTVSGTADSTTIIAKAKNLPLKLNIIDRNSYYQVSAKLPPELNGKYARIHLKVKAQKGECISKDGWLIKIKPAAAAQEATEE